MWGIITMSQFDDIFPVLQRRTLGRLNRNIDPVRRELWHAFQRGGLSEEEFVSALDRLEFATPVLEPTLASPPRS